MRWPLLVIAVWIALAVGLSQLFPPLAVLAQKAPASILPADAPSVVSQKQMADAFQEASSDNILLVVLTNENGFTPADEAVYRELWSANCAPKPRTSPHFRTSSPHRHCERSWSARTTRPGCCRSTSSAK